MTSTGSGVTWFTLRDNPMMLDYHCIAHKLALVTSQSSYVSGKQIVDSIKVKFIDQLVQRPRIIIYIVDIFCS